MQGIRSAGAYAPVLVGGRAQHRLDEEGRTLDSSPCDLRRPGSSSCICLSCAVRKSSHAFIGRGGRSVRLLFVGVSSAAMGELRDVVGEGEGCACRVSPSACECGIVTASAGGRD